MGEVAESAVTDLRTAYDELRAENERLRRVAAENHRKREDAGAWVEDGGAWEDRAKVAEARLERAEAERDYLLDRYLSLARTVSATAIVDAALSSTGEDNDAYPSLRRAMEQGRVAGENRPASRRLRWTSGEDNDGE